MKKTKRKLFIWSIVIILLMSCFLTACGETETDRNPYDLKVLEATNDFYVNDFAQLLSEEQKSKMMESAVNMDEEYAGIQVVVTTVESLKKTVLEYSAENIKEFEIEQVAYAMYAQYGIGQDDMGILILFSTGDREVRIETGKQMQAYITDSISGQILDDYGMPYFSEDQFADGLVAVQNAVISEIKERVPKNWNSSSITSSTTEVDKEVIDEPIKSTAKNDEVEEKSSNQGLIKGFFMSIFGFFAAIIAFIYKTITGKKKLKAKEVQKQRELEAERDLHNEQLTCIETTYKSEIGRLKSQFTRIQNEKDSKIGLMQSTIDRLNENLNEANAKIQNLADKYARVQVLYPEINFEKEIEKMIEDEFQESAINIDKQLEETLGMPADKDSIDVFYKALSLYDSAKPEVKKYVKANRQELVKLYSSSINLKKEYEKAEQEKRDKAIANEVYESIRIVYANNPEGNYNTYEALNAANNKYCNLTNEQKEFFPDREMIQRLQRVLALAEEDYRNVNMARNAENEINFIIRGIYSPDEDDRDKLARAMRFYKNLTSTQQAYFSAELFHKLKRMIDEAEEDHRCQERRRQERRRQSSYNSSHRSSTTPRRSSNPARSSFRGHGGRPSGGGASRRF